jgi:hypothetical protein
MSKLQGWAIRGGIVVEYQYQGDGIGIVLLVVKNIYTQYQTNTKILLAELQ